jgi:cytochrome c-type biogenesis protein
MTLHIGIAFWAGLISFLSPCCFPLYPSFLSYITGISIQQLKQQTGASVRVKIIWHTVFFVLGLSMIFFTFAYTLGTIGDLFISNRELIRKIAGLFIFLMGLIMLGVFQPKLLMREMKWQFQSKRSGYLGSFLIGIGFAAGWSPCIGPILGSIGALAASQPGSWFSLMAAYVMGFGLPFVGLAFFVGSTKWIARYSGIIAKVGGVVMIVIGILLFTGYLTKLTVWLNLITPDFLKI